MERGKEGERIVGDRRRGRMAPIGKSKSASE